MYICRAQTRSHAFGVLSTIVGICCEYNVDFEKLIFFGL